MDDQNNSFFHPPMLTLEDLSWLQEMGEIENGIFRLKRNRSGRKLRTPVSFPVDRILDIGQSGLVEFIIGSLVLERPKLVPFVLENRSLIELGRYLLRYRSGSPNTFYLYAHLIEYFSKWMRRTPDEIVADVKDLNDMPKPEKVQIHAKWLEDYVAHLQDRRLAPNRIANYIRAVKVLYKTSGIRIDLPYSLPRRVVRRDRAPTPEELLKLLEIADLRERVIILMLALGGFREGTLVRLQYRHVQRDLETGVVPIHIHIEAEITKGKYHDYDTFIGPEATEYLKLYLEDRRKGSPDGKMPPEDITGVSPLIRDSHLQIPKPIGEKQVYKLVHNLYFKAGLLNPSAGGGYDLRVHSLRKFFKTQLMAARVQPDYIDYIMGHTIDTYDDVQSRGIEFLRKIYATAELRIRPTPKLSPLAQLKVFAIGLGLDPDKLIPEGSFVEPHRAIVSSEEMENRQVQVLSSAIKDAIKQEIMQDLKSQEIRGWSDGVAGI